MVSPGLRGYSGEYLDAGEKLASCPELEGTTEGCGGGDSMASPEGTRSRGGTTGRGLQMFHVKPCFSIRGLEEVPRPFLRPDNLLYEAPLGLYWPQCSESG